MVDHVRLFRLRPDVRWAYRVHEQVLPALRRIGADVRWVDAAVDHGGYTDPAVRRRKLDRDLRLLRRELDAAPGEPFVPFNLGAVYQELGRPADALAALEASLRASHPRDSIVRKLYARIAGCRRELGDRAGAAAAVAEGRGHYPADAELLFLDGLLRRDGGDLAGAERAFGELVRGADGPHFASVDAGLRGVKGWHNLAVVYAEQGRPAEAAGDGRGPGVRPGLARAGRVTHRGPGLAGGGGTGGRVGAGRPGRGPRGGGPTGAGVARPGGGRASPCGPGRRAGPPPGRPAPPAPGGSRRWYSDRGRGRPRLSLSQSDRRHRHAVRVNRIPLRRGTDGSQWLTG